jgi:hypothetical protein
VTAHRATTTVLVVTIAAVLTGCARQPARPDDPAGRPTAARGVERPAPLLIDADPHGAIIMDGQGRYVGVTRDGAVVWREPAGARAFAAVSCLVRCPDAVLSASVEAINAATAADPVPRLVVDGRWQHLTALGGHKRRVLTATSAEELVTAGGDGTRWWLELHRAGAPVRRVAVGGFNSSWHESADARNGLVVTTVAGGNQARWFSRTGSGWRPAGATVRVDGLGACVAPDGRRALLLGQRPMVIDRRGVKRPWTDLVSAGACAWAASGGIVAELSHTGRGPRSRLRAFDDAGVVRWRLDLTAAALVAADPTGSRVAYLAGRVLHELDPARGVELRTIPGVKAARYDARGELVTITDDATTTWRP